MKKPLQTMIVNNTPLTPSAMGVILALLCGGLLAGCGGASDTSAANPGAGTFNPLTVVSINKSGSGSFCNADLKLTNTSPDTIRFTYDYDALGANNRVVARTIFNATIAPGSTQTFSQSWIFPNATNIPINSRCQAISAIKKTNSSAVKAILRSLAVATSTAIDSRLVGVWSSPSWALSIAPDGRIYGQNNDGCIIHGGIATEALIANTYPASITLSLCGDDTGRYHGIIAIIDNPPGTASRLLAWNNAGKDKRFTFNVSH